MQSETANFAPTAELDDAYVSSLILAYSLHYDENTTLSTKQKLRYVVLPSEKDQDMATD